MKSIFYKIPQKYRSKIKQNVNFDGFEECIFEECVNTFRLFIIIYNDVAVGFSLNKIFTVTHPDFNFLKSYKYNEILKKCSENNYKFFKTI